jgi:hypothetical protein
VTRLLVNAFSSTFYSYIIFFGRINYLLHWVIHESMITLGEDVRAGVDVLKNVRQWYIILISPHVLLRNIHFASVQRNNKDIIFRLRSLS